MGSKKLVSILKGGGKSSKKSEQDELREIVYSAAKDAPKRDLKNIVVASKKLTRALNLKLRGEDISFTEINSLFVDFINQYNAEGYRNFRKFHPSSLRGDCERMLYYAIGGTPFSDEVPDTITGQTQIIFDQGHWFHSYIQAALKRAGILIEAEVPVVDKDRFLDGRMDGKIKFKGKVMGLEIKTMNSFRFAKGKIKPFDDNVAQNSFYADHLGIDWLCLLYFNKDTCELAVHIIDVDKKMVKLMNEKVDDTLEAIKVKKEPRRSCTSIDSPLAKGCPFKSTCFKF